MKSEPAVNLDYFRHGEAKAILWRSAEELFDTLDPEGYWANSAAYAVAWLAENSDRRIDLNRIWSEQRLSPALCEGLKTVCREAWEHLNHQQGNIGQASKKAECWEAFRRKGIALKADWQAELADGPFIAPRPEEEALAAAWEQLRRKFLDDFRTSEALEACTGREWVRTRRRDTVFSYAALSRDQLRLRRGLGLKKLRALVEMFAIAAQG